MSKVLCIYHGNCQDGFGAAWAVRHALGEDAVEFFPGVYQTEPPEVMGRDVLMVDFSYKRAVIDNMRGRANSILILDHHKSAEEDLRDLYIAPAWNIWRQLIDNKATPMSSGVRCVVRFDLERSGAGIAWDYFHPGERRPAVIDHIEDRDLWQFRLPETREISAALFSLPYDFALWDRIMSGEYSTRDLVVAGEAIERKHHQDIANLLPVVQREMTIGGVRMPVACLPLTLTSDAGHKMAIEAKGVAACYWDTPEGRVFSLRSTDDGPDVSVIAKQYGGGGHAHAAGFRVALGWEGE